MQEVKQKNNQDSFFATIENLDTSTSEVECYVCGKGIQDGHSITAKTIRSEIVLLCNIHCP